MENLLKYDIHTAVWKKTEQIWNRSQCREAAWNIKFFINIDCLGTYVVERTKKFWNLNVYSPRGCVYSNALIINGLRTRFQGLKYTVGRYKIC